MNHLMIVIALISTASISLAEGWELTLKIPQMDQVSRATANTAKDKCSGTDGTNSIGMKFDVTDANEVTVNVTCNNSAVFNLNLNQISE